MKNDNKVRYTYWVDEDLINKVKHIAIDKNTYANSIIDKAIAMYLDKELPTKEPYSPLDSNGNAISLSDFDNYDKDSLELEELISKANGNIEDESVQEFIKDKGLMQLKCVLIIIQREKHLSDESKSSENRNGSNAININDMNTQKLVDDIECPFEMTPLGFGLD